MTHVHFNITKLMTHITIHVGFNALRSRWVTTHSYSCLNVRLSIKQSTLGMLIGPKDPIPLWHFSLKETKAKVDLLEDQYDLPMRFDPDLIPDLAVAGQNVGAWGQGVAMYGATRGYRQSHTMPTLLASMFGFECEEEMEETKQYLLSHSSFQLEQVGGWWPTVILM